MIRVTGKKDFHLAPPGTISLQMQPLHWSDSKSVTCPSFLQSLRFMTSLHFSSEKAYPSPCPLGAWSFTVIICFFIFSVTAVFLIGRFSGAEVIFHHLEGRFSSLDTWAWEMPMISATSIWVSLRKKRREMISYSLSFQFFLWLHWGKVLHPGFFFIFYR